jgi:TetR/AcrR family transcriptional regulator
MPSGQSSTLLKPSSAESAEIDNASASAHGTAALLDALEPLAQLETTEPSAPTLSKRPKPGERRIQILQMLGSMLEQPVPERITTASLAARLQVSEAALYRHFASKAKMFEGIMDFIESSIFTLVNQIIVHEERNMAQEANAANRAHAGNGAMHTPGLAERQALKIVTMLMQFAEKNPGMVRVMVGDALVLEHERLLLRMNQLFEKLESTLKQCLSQADTAQAAHASVTASVLIAFVQGRLHRFVRSGFVRKPSEHLHLSLRLIFG